MNDNKRYSLVLTRNFIKKLDTIKESKGFKHRSDAIIYLCNIALDFLLDNNKI